MLLLMITDGGITDPADNATIGPPVHTMVKWGAKETALIVYENQWWRLVSSLMLHAGIFHLVPNVAVQLRIGGYLNLVYGTPVFAAVYLCSGTFGALCSCLAYPNHVSVGSSGSLMGELSSWVVWLLFRWTAIPEQARNHRNCQLVSLLCMIGLVVSTSFSSSVDSAAHLGGMGMGALMGATLHSKHIKHDLARKLVAGCCVVTAITLYAVAVYMVAVVKPDRDNLDLWKNNDDFN
jgi:membrane associated rhomboid family serine protease